MRKSISKTIINRIIATTLLACASILLTGCRYSKSEIETLLFDDECPDRPEGGICNNFYAIGDVAIVIYDGKIEVKNVSTNNTKADDAGSYPTRIDELSEGYLFAEIDGSDDYSQS